MFCSGGWSKACPCNPRSDFCEAKELWISLVEEFHQGPPWGLTGEEPFYLAEAMTVKQWEATGLTMRILPPTGRDEIRVGARGTSFETLENLALLYGTNDYHEAMQSVIRIQKVMR